MYSVKNDYRKEYTVTLYPDKIKHNYHAQAFYGVIKEIIENIDLYGTTEEDRVQETERIEDCLYYEDILTNIVYCTHRHRHF